MSELTSDVADTICRTVELGVTITGAVDPADRTHLWCQVLDPETGCPGCGTTGRLRDHVDRELTDIPISGPTQHCCTWLYRGSSATTMPANC